MLHFCTYAILVSYFFSLPLEKKKKKKKQLGSPFHVPETCRQEVHPDAHFSEAFLGVRPPLRTLSVSWTRALLSRWSASHQPRDPVQRGRGCRRVLLLRAHTCSGASVSRWQRQFLELTAHVVGQQCPVAELPHPPGDRLCLAGTSLLPQLLSFQRNQVHSQHERRGHCCSSCWKGQSWLGSRRLPGS